MSPGKTISAARRSLSCDKSLH
uniref:Uncharacterized protein n=1 Tax=Anguilla anguilla TaxID=7936 RepID=A0A0E9TMM3_ANGAN